MTHNDRPRKRSRGEYERDHHFARDAALSSLQGETETSRPAADAQDATENEQKNGDSSAGEWQTAESKGMKKRKTLPKKEGGNYPEISHSASARLQSFVKLSDLQNLALYMLADGTAPQWCAVKHHANVRKVVAVMAPGLEAGMFNGSIPLSDAGPEDRTDTNGHANADSAGLAQQKVNASTDATTASSYSPAKKIPISPDDYYPNRLKYNRMPDPLQPLAEMFEHIWPIKTPGDDRHAKMHSPLAAMLTAPLVKTKEEKRLKGPQPPLESKNWKNQRVPVTELVANKDELADEGYIIHPAMYKDSPTAIEDGWVDTPNIDHVWTDNASDRDSLLQGKNVLAMDCEMCITSPSGTTPQVFSLTRISIIDWDGNVVLDEFVKPSDPITDYLTPYSGITPAMLENVTTTLQDIQQKLTTSILTPDTILIGHSLNSDLKALKFTHPYVIDTALLFPHPRGPPLKSSLKWLAQKYLSREIQKGHGSTGHDSIEDAKACLDLVKQKCEKGKAWGTSEASGESIFKRLARHQRPKRDKVNTIGPEEYREGAVVDWGEPSRGYGAQARLAIGCESDDDIVAGVKRAIEGEAFSSSVPKGGVDFVFARLRELEAHRGWWNRSKTADNAELLSTTTETNSAATLSAVVSQTIANIRQIYDALPPCTAFIVYSGSGDPRELAEMQALQQKFKEEYRVKKWDQLNVRWTDVEEQKLRRACEKARKGVGFVTVK